MAATDSPDSFLDRLPRTNDLILDRLAANSRPGARDDDYRVALVVEGGGMRGVVPGGMLLALEQLGLRNSFDMVVGTSAGAIMSAFFITGLASQAAPIYYGELNQEPFLNKRRLLRLQPALDLDYLVDDALTDRGLSTHEVAFNPIALFATLCPIDADNPTRVVRVNGDDARVRSILKATASLPVLAGAAKEVDGELYVDGGLHSQIPWQAAADLGATHILVLPSRAISEDNERADYTFIERYTVLPIVRRMHGEHITDVLRGLASRANAESSGLASMAHGQSYGLTSTGAPWLGDIDFVQIVAGTEMPDRLETEQSRLVNAMRDGARAMLDHLGMANISVENRISLDHPAARIGHYTSGALSQIVAARHKAMQSDG